MLWNTLKILKKLKMRWLDRMMQKEIMTNLEMLESNRARATIVRTSNSQGRVTLYN